MEDNLYDSLCVLIQSMWCDAYQSILKLEQQEMKFAALLQERKHKGLPTEDIELNLAILRVVVSQMKTDCKEVQEEHERAVRMTLSSNDPAISAYAFKLTDFEGICALKEVLRFKRRPRIERIRTRSVTKRKLEFS